jgi:hypothetical protein
MFGFSRPSAKDDLYACKVHKAINNTLSRLALCKTNGPADFWIKYWKYKTNAFFAHYENQPLPVKPDWIQDENPGYIFGGIIGQWLRSQIYQNPNSELLLSILMIKKGMPRADDELIHIAERKTFEALTTPKVVLIPKWPDGVEERYRYIMGPGLPWKDSKFRRVFGAEGFKAECRNGPTRPQLESQLKRTVREIFTGMSFGPAKMSKPVFPSTSANYNNTRARGGGLGFLKGEHGCSKLGNIHSVPFGGVAYNRQTEFHGTVGEEDQENICVDESVEKVFYKIEDDVTIPYRQFYWKTFHDCLDEIPLVAPVGLAEALKIRVITKGPPRLNFVLKSLQKFLWKVLSQHPTFRLIGRPVRVEDIEEIAGFRDRWINSGDYVASTDNLCGWVSDVILDQLEETLGLPHQLTRLVRRALTGHLIEMDGEIRGQQNGQLMGSIISFPFLCIANAAACRWSLEIAEKRMIELRKSRIMINGDDNLIATHCKLFNKIWEVVCASIGLESSPGKTYFSKDFAVINSVHYDWTDGRWIQRRYVNMGLIKGQTRSGESSLLKEKASAWNELVESLPAEVLESGKKMFFYYNKKILCQFKGSFWLPEWAGGLGMRRDPTSHDRKLLWIALRSDLSKVQSWPSQKEWRTWDLVQDQLKTLPLYHNHSYKACLYDKDYDLEREERVLTKYLVVRAFLTERLAVLLPHGKRDLVALQNRIIKKNEDLFNYYLRALSKGGCGKVSKADFYTRKTATFPNVLFEKFDNQQG